MPSSQYVYSVNWAVQHQTRPGVAPSLAFLLPSLSLDPLCLPLPSFLHISVAPLQFFRDMSCNACHYEHPSTMRCEVAARLRGSSQVDQLVVHSKHGVYADLVKRKTYRREWMRSKRAQRIG